MNWKKVVGGKVEVHAKHYRRDDISLCGCDMVGESSLGPDENYEQVTETDLPINCRDCIAIIKWAKSFRLREK